jgi:AcrR family transcriptional regulator
MSENVNPRRRYDSSGRRARAQRTREEIADAARRLFEEQGYAQTTVTDIAKAAHVSPETVYNAFGSKGALLAAVVSASVRGDTADTPLRRRPVIDAIRDADTPRDALRLYGTLLAEVNPRLVPLIRVMREAAPGDAEIADALVQLGADRLDGMSEFAAHLASKGWLRDGISRREASDVLWTQGSPEVYELLVIERGWSARRYGRWVAVALAAALLDGDAAN